MFSKSDRFCVIGIHKVPADLSREEFVTKINAFLDKVCILPVLKEKMVKLEILSQNDVSDLHLKKKGLPTAQSTSILVAESKTVEDMLMLMGNPDLRHSAGQSGEPQKGVSVFSVDVISKIGEH
ncbi:hypothetical protein B0H13DRAFT_2281012 [Mycena leptocephala]|nr:hypothetical protein B0H13DRAFT_2281012 [Mycena leptocephala]